MIVQDDVDDLVMETMNIVWQDEYNIGNEMVDHQHQTLFQIAGRALLLKSTHDNSEKAHAELKEIIKELFDYTVKHFSDEEDYMKSIGYPTLDEHIIRHKQIITVFEDFVEKLENLTIEEIEDGLYSFVKAYFIEHITGMDNDIGVWVQKQK